MGKQILGQAFLRDLGAVSVSEAVAGIAAFLYIMVVSRRLGVSDYGLFQAVMALFSILTIFVGPLNLATVHCVSVSDDPQKSAVVGSLVRFSFWIGIACASLVVLLSSWLTGVLYGGIGPVICVAVLVALTAVLTVFYGAWQAYGAYTAYAITRIAESLIRLGVGSILVMAGTGASGAVLGYVLGTGSLLALSFARTRFYSFSRGRFDVRSQLETFVGILSVYGTIFFVGDFPVVLARSRLGAEASGLYGALYGLRTLVLPFCLASVAPLYARTVGVSSGHKPFLQVLVPILGLGGVFFLVGVFLPRLPFQIIYGTAFVGAARYMAGYGIALSLQMVSIITMFYQIAQKRLERVYLLVPVLILVTGAVWPGLSIPKLVLIQVVAWALYLLIVLGSITVRKMSSTRAGGL